MIRSDKNSSLYKNVLYKVYNTLYKSVQKKLTGKRLQIQKHFKISTFFKFSFFSLIENCNSNHAWTTCGNLYVEIFILISFSEKIKSKNKILLWDVSVLFLIHYLCNIWHSNVVKFFNSKIFIYKVILNVILIIYFLCLIIIFSFFFIFVFLLINGNNYFFEKFYSLIFIIYIVKFLLKFDKFFDTQ